MGDDMDAGYLQRISDEKLKLLLQAKGAVLIEGPKWCGKTSSAEEVAKSVLYMQDTDNIKANLLTAKTKPSLLLEGETPRLIDEWQVAPELWNAVRFAVDKRKQKGQFILTGSVIPTRTDDMHTGTGRIARMKMRTMSLFETGDSTGEISLEALFNGEEDMDGISKLSNFPEMCEVYHRRPQYRRLSVEDYLILYQVNESEQSIDIHRIFYAGRNIQKLID